MSPFFQFYWQQISTIGDFIKFQVATTMHHNSHMPNDYVYVS
jgi:hypothetical protein